MELPRETVIRKVVENVLNAFIRGPSLSIYIDNAIYDIYGKDYEKLSVEANLQLIKVVRERLMTHIQYRAK